MLIGGIVAAVVVVALTITLLTRRVAHDDVHSVEGYHRSLHTLESIKTHPVLPEREAEPGPVAKPAYPESAVRLAGVPSARLTDRPPSAVPPVSLRAMAEPDVPVAFEDDGSPAAPILPPGSNRRDKAMLTINHRPRRLAAPAMALAAVSALIVVLVVTGSHTVAPPRHHETGSGSAKGKTSSPAAHPPPTPSATTTPSTQPPAVSLPQQSTTRNATYDVSSNDFALNLTATAGACWVDVTNSTSGTMYFEGVLEPGAQQALDVSGAVTVVVGAPTVFGASVNGTTVALPAGFQTPFTMNFVIAPPA